MPCAILDTSVYIEHWEGRLAESALSVVRKDFIVRHSSVVLSELRRGARTAAARRLVESQKKLASVEWEPTRADWWEAASLIQRIGDVRGWNPAKRRDFQNDALIALTARRHGAAVVTGNSGDFGLLARELRIRVIAMNSTG